MNANKSQITSVSIICSAVCSGVDQIKHQRSASLAFVWGIHRWTVNSTLKGPVTWKCFHLITSSWTMHCVYIFINHSIRYISLVTPNNYKLIHLLNKYSLGWWQKTFLWHKWPPLWREKWASFTERELLLKFGFTTHGNTCLCNFDAICIFRHQWPLNDHCIDPRVY